jgi:large subunit ribosomal protein L32
MPTPKKKTSRAKRGMRRSHDFIEKSELRTCETTGQLHRPHRAVKGDDGALYYKGKQITTAKYEA